MHSNYVFIVYNYNKYYSFVPVVSSLSYHIAYDNDDEE